MTHPPFAFPDTIEADLAALCAQWSQLKRGQAEMPFADDVKLSALPHPASAMLIDVFARRARFRFAIVGETIRTFYGKDLDGRFADEIAARPPFDYFLAQCSATVEARAPTYYRAKSYARVLLPLWGEGHIHMLLGGVTTAKH